MRKRKPRRKAIPTSLAKLLGPELRKIGPPPVPLEVQRGWSDVVGERVSERAVPVRTRRHTLIIRVSSNAWMVELQMLAPRIIQRLREVAPDAGIREIRFELGQLPARESPHRSTAIPARRWRRRPGEALPDHIAEALDGVDDPALRERIRETLKHALYE